MRASLRAYATPLATATASVVGGSGVLMFFHLFERQVKELHEWFGIVAVAAVLLHVVRNWSAFTVYFVRGRAMAVSLAAGGLVALAFLGASLMEDPGGRPDPRGLLRALEDATVAEIAVPLHREPADLVQRLHSAGFAGAAPDSPIRALASGAGVPPPAVLAVLTAE
ncbi:MAG: DUF4405 domain-containing protein [Myxococcota bacterium]